jgi:hypothetical protein
LEVQNYHQSIEKHTYIQGIENIMAFIEVFAAKLKPEAPEQESTQAWLLGKLAWGFQS